MPEQFAHIEQPMVEIRADIAATVDAFCESISCAFLRFISIMKQTIDDNEMIEYVIIGTCNIDFEKYGIKERVHCLGFRTDFESVLQAVDLCVNPRRSGAGSNARAITRMTPLLTLPGCDAAASAGNNPAFICEKYEDYPRVIDRYINDEEFRKKQMDECRRVIESRKGKNIYSEIARVDRLIRECICNDIDGVL